MRLKEKIALVTGASRGIGKAIALHLAEEGAQIIINYAKNSEKAKEVVAAVESTGGKALAMQADVACWQEVEKMVDSIYEKFGRIDILVNNAGVNRDELLISMEKEDWDAVINTNLGGLFHCTKAVAKYMMIQKNGRIINMSSVAGERGGRGQSNYAASKGGVNAFTRSVAMELAPKKITVNAIAPGVIETEMSSTVIRRAKDFILNSVALKRLGQPEEIAKVVAFLASDDSSYITGEVIRVDGGFKG
ncbi:MAG: 3-oxoacyl-[acyl-carrier-protein] reductase [Deltaproteobacteria bacterium]|jgi:3-oxoacyl-[acyl-carrier protein] reductase|nr:3-oxoacyl-[acyl-carrier-protein] reductase [Deltaproteobacteria bacterium]MBW2553280.1 3-oxoacyl-[acyl-carrier-protein] reductase [Deltaproteobacteria bacterium]